MPKKAAKWDDKGQVSSPLSEQHEATAAAIGVVPPPPKQEESIPELKNLITDKKDYLELKRLVTASVQLQQQEAEIKKARKPVTDRLKNLLGKYAVGKAQLDEARINYFASERKTITPAALLAHGISPNIIQACTTVTQSFTLKITTGKDDDED